MKNFRLDDEYGDRVFDAPSHSVELTPNDSLFAMLDGQIIRGRAGAWRAEVVSIVTDGPDTWVQVGRAGNPGSTVMLHMDQRRRADDAIDALRSWTDIPEHSRPGRIDLAHRPDQRRIDREPLKGEIESHLRQLRTAHRFN